MYKKTELLLFVGLLFSLLTLSSTPIEAQLTGYPPLDATPPPVKEWTDLVDMSKVPKAPVRALASDCGDPKDPFCIWTCTRCTKPEDIMTCPKVNDWAITYDDGPSLFTTGILDHLKAKNAKATFFVIGSRVLGNPDILRRTLKEGHQVGIHTWSHKPLTTQTTEEIISELKWTEKIIKEVGGVTPKFMRPPQGDYDDRVRFIAKSLGYNIAIWDNDTFDWKSNGDPTFDLNWITGNFTQWVTDKKTGHMSLEHDLYEQTAKLAPKAIDIVLNAGWNMKDVATCVNLPAYVEAGPDTQKLDQSSSTTVSGFLLALAPLNIAAQPEQVLQGYPPVNAVPPATAKFTELVDLTMVPNAPIRTAPTQPCDGPDDPFCYWSCTICVRSYDVKTCPSAKDWAFTFDDGPSEFTPKLLDYLKAKDVKATFYVVGSRVSEYPEILKRVSEEGHEIGIHTWSHTPLTTLTNEIIISEILWTEQAIVEATGKKPVTIRPPQGDYDDRVRYIAKSLGYKVVLWNHDPFDWKSTEDPTYDLNWIPGNFSQWVKEPLTAGPISLEHDLYEQTVSKAPSAIDVVMNAGFNIKTIASCVGDPAFGGDNSTTSSTAPKSTASKSSAQSQTPAFNNNQYGAPSSANLLTTDYSFIWLSLTTVIMIVPYSFKFLN